MTERINTHGSASAEDLSAKETFPGPGAPENTLSRERAENSRMAFLSLLGYIKKYFPAMIVAVLLGGAGAVLCVIGPGKLSEVTDLITRGLTGTVDLASTGRICMLLAVLYGLAWAFGYVQNFILATVTQRVTKQLRSDISGKTERTPLRYFDGTSLGDILSRVTNDVDTIGQMLGNSFGTLISSVTLLFGSVIMMFVTNFAMAASAIFSSLIGAALMIVIMSRSQKYFLSQQTSFRRLQNARSRVITAFF